MQSVMSTSSPPLNSKVQKSKSVPKKRLSPRKHRNNNAAQIKKLGMIAPIVSSRQTAQAAAGRASQFRETWQMVSDVDRKLGDQTTQVISGLFDEDAHNAKRQILLKRAAEAKKRIEA